MSEAKPPKPPTRATVDHLRVELSRMRERSDRLEQQLATVRACAFDVGTVIEGLAMMVEHRVNISDPAERDEFIDGLLKSLRGLAAAARSHELDDDCPF